jgi:Diadenosine tetraphosphate (Ap4A) hydrolase and other HIT family hydrolases
MVAPLRHVNDLSKLSEAETLDLLRNLKEVKAILSKILKPQGFNIGLNIGRVSGAGFPGHIHIHIVPRWNGDTNFMPIVSKTKVLSQSLNELYKK